METVPTAWPSPSPGPVTFAVRELRTGMVRLSGHEYVVPPMRRAEEGSIMHEVGSNAATTRPNRRSPPRRRRRDDGARIARTRTARRRDASAGDAAVGGAGAPGRPCAGGSCPGGGARLAIVARGASGPGRGPAGGERAGDRRGARSRGRGVSRGCLALGGRDAVPVRRPARSTAPGHPAWIPLARPAGGPGRGYRSACSGAKKTSRVRSSAMAWKRCSALAATKQMLPGPTGRSVSPTRRTARPATT